MTNSTKKKIQNTVKSIGYYFWSLIYGKISEVTDAKNNKLISVYYKKIDDLFSYQIFEIKNCRVYTDTITDTAFIVENKVIKDASFQHRNTKNSDINNNIVFYKGTPRLKKKFSGKMFSLLTGGGGNSNYWHWLFDVLPRLKILENQMNVNDIDYFLFPDLKERFQNETLDFLNIPKKKRISSRDHRHVESDVAITVDHPYIFKNDPSSEIQNLPEWILKYLREKFLIKLNKKRFPKKFFIDRKDSKSNHRHLRKIINEEEVKEFLLKKDFTIVTLSDYSFEDQINLFNQATEIVGLHGAGLANLTFCKPKTSVIELKSISAGSVCENLAKKIKLDYKDISVTPLKYIQNNQQGHINIPINLLEKKIKL